MKTEYAKWINKDVNARVDAPEYWKPLPDKPPYEVSSRGRFRNRRTGHVIMPKYNKSQSLTVSLFVDGRSRTFCVRSLIWRAFAGEIPKGMRVASKSRAKSECDLESLELVSNSEWGKYRGRCNGKSVIKIDPAGKVVKVYRSVTEAAKANGYTEATLSHRCVWSNVRTPAADGCDYAYEDDLMSIRRALKRLGVDWRSWEYEQDS